MMTKTFFITLLITSRIIINFTTMQTMNQPDKSTVIFNEIFTKGNIEISFPQFSGFKDIELQDRINSLLKKEAFREYEDYENYKPLSDVSISINHEIIYQDEKTISVFYTGYAYNKNASYPHDVFTTINIDLESGNKILLNDIVEIDNVFVEKLRDILSLYIIEDPDREPIYSERLNDDNKQLLELLMHTDSEKSSDCFSYVTKDYLGILINTRHDGGGPIEFKMMYSDIEEYIRKSMP